MLDLDLIRIDGGTQSRVELDAATVAEYAEAFAAGAEFPAVTVFFDGSDRWLADGFHRYFGAKKAGKKQILEHIIPGTQREAVLYSVKANGTHGLKRTNADKRKAVETLAKDEEWGKWSDRKIAEAAGVSVTFVSALRRPEVKEQRDKNRKTSAEKAAGCSPATPPLSTSKVESNSTLEATPAPASQPKPVKVEPEDADYTGPSQAEIDAAIEGTKEDIDFLNKLMEADDKLAAAVGENEKLRAELAVVKLSRDGYMNQANELIRRVKSLKKKLDKAEAANV